jgi:hypothetical protein
MDHWEFEWKKMPHDNLNEIFVLLFKFIDFFEWITYRQKVSDNQDYSKDYCNQMKDMIEELDNY